MAVSSMDGLFLPGAAVAEHKGCSRGNVGVCAWHCGCLCGSVVLRLWLWCGPKQHTSAYHAFASTPPLRVQPIRVRTFTTSDRPLSNPTRPPSPAVAPRLWQAGDTPTKA